MTTVDIDQLLENLRRESALHEPSVAAPVATPWGPPATDPRKCQAAVLAALNASLGWRTSLLSDETACIDRAYWDWLGRQPDPGGMAHALEQLRLGTPRSVWMLELALSAEAQAFSPMRPLTRVLLRGLRRLLHTPSPRVNRLLQKVWHRVERRYTAHLKSRPDVASLALARSVDAIVAEWQARWHLQSAAHQECLDTLSSARRHPGTGVLEQPDLADYMRAFEAHFRGSVEALHQQLQHDYLPHVRAAQARCGDALCLDVGCGRGVWLGVLQQHGFAGRGVDLNPAAVEQARQQGLEAEVGDAIEWLQRQPRHSAMLISAFHVLEHLPLSVRLQLVTEAARVLKPGGRLLLETPNPENIWVATHTFYHDPTHSQPLTPDSLAFLVQYAGLTVLEVPRLHPYPAEALVPGDDPTTQRVNGLTGCGQDFAIVAEQPLP